jgi:catechol 2,3-dioxygenase-like lactoylglutathione lyase family enzyme
VGQLGFIVNSIETSLPYYASCYNLDTWFWPKYADKQFLIGSEPVEVDVDLAFAFSGKTQIELVEASGPVETLYHRHLADHGEGLHHLGFYVSNFDERLRVIEKLGIELLLEARFKTAGGGLAQTAFLGTEQLCGSILELIAIRLYGISIPQTSFMMNVAAITGDVLKIRI